MYDHSNSEHESGDSMGDSGNRNSNTPTKRKSGAAASSEKPRSCSYCGKEYLASESKNVPFCSRRCQQIDLGMWLTESYGMPYEGEAGPGQVDQRFDED